MSSSVLLGLPGAPGVGVGRLARVASSPSQTDDAVRIPVKGVQHEQDRLRAALGQAAAQLNELARMTAASAGEEVGAIFEAQALFAADPALVQPALQRIAAELISAEAALGVVADEQADRLASVDDEYFRERAADVRDVARRVRQILSGEVGMHLEDGGAALPVLLADDMDASLVAELRPQLVAGICLAGGAPTGHAAIVARALGLPLVLGMGGQIAGLPAGQPAAVDGNRGRLLVDPSPEELAGLVPVREAAVVAGRTTNLPGVSLEANVASLREAEAAAAAGAEGIGLVRTELLFLGRRTMPSLEEQRALYGRIAAALPGAPVAFRTFDVGGDKSVGYAPESIEANPALGIRGLRLGLRQPDLLRTQLRALLEATPWAELHVMFPMVATLEELRAARTILDEAAAAALAAGAEISAAVRVGIMVEIPSTAVLADQFAAEVDFFSIGTNDLTQYTMAADRTNPALASTAAAVQPAILRLVAGVVEAARAHKRPVAVCGEAASDPLAGPLLLGLGVTSLSVAVGQLDLVRRRLADMPADAWAEAGRQALRAGTLDEVIAIASAVES